MNFRISTHYARNFFIASLLFVFTTAFGQNFDPIPNQCNSNAPVDLSLLVDMPGGTFSIIPGSTPGLIGDTFDPSLSGNGTFTIRWDHPGPGHEDEKVTVYGPTAPSTIASNPDKFCMDQGGNITLSVSDGSGAHLHWSTGNFCDEIIVGEGNNYTIPAPTTTTTYFAYWEDASGCRSVCDNYAVVVYPVDASGMDITSIESPYCKNDPNDDVFGIYNYGYLNKVFTLTPASGGFSDNGDGSATISPTAMAQNTYIMTYTVSIDNCQHSTTAPFVINPPLIIDFAITTPVCSNALPQLLTGSEAPEGHFSGPGITDYGDGTAEFDPGAAGPGTHTITYTYTDPDECFATVSHDVVVFDDPIVSFATLNAHYCAGDPPVNLIGNQAPLGDFSITPVTVIAPDFIINGDGTATFNPNGATTGPGTYSITYEYTDGNSCYGSETQTTEVHAILTPTITGDATPCQNIDLIYTTEAGMNNYNWVVSAGGTVVSGGTTSDNTITINWGSTGPQTLQITYDNSNGGCTSNTVTLNLNVLAQPSASLAPFSNVCLDDAAFLLSGGTASPGGGTEIYDVDGVPTVIFDPSVIGSVPDPHVITYTYIAPNGCQNSASENIRVLDLNAAVNSLDASYCYLTPDETLVGNNTDGGIGVFTITPPPTNPAILTDNGNNTATLSPGNCAPADYNTTFTITYTYTNGTCSASDQTSTFIYGQPSVSITGLDGTYCTDDAIDLFTGNPSGGAFSTTAIPASLTDDAAGNGSFDPSIAGATGSPYTISYYYADAQGCNATDIQTVTVDQTPDPVLSSSDGDNIICYGENVIFTATDNNSAADTYEFFINGFNVQGPNGSNTYPTTSLNDGETVTVILSVSTSACEATSAGITTTVVAAPSPTFISGNTNVCEEDAGEVYTTQAGQQNYAWIVVGGTITAGGTATDNTATVSWNTPGAQSISVNYENATGCAAASPTLLNVSVGPLPDETLNLSDPVICSGETALITLSNSELGVTYQLRLDSDNTPVGPALNGTGGDIIFSDTPPITTVYNIIGSSAAGCISVMLDKSVVSVNPSPDPSLTIVYTEACYGGSATITLQNSEVGVSYQLRLDSDNTNQGVPLVGNGTDLTWTVAPLVTTTYNIWATNGVNCSVQMITKAVITINPLPDNSLTFEGDEICRGETANLILYNSDNGVSYQLRLDSDDTHIGPPQVGNNGNLSFSVSPVSNTVYNIYATDANACNNELTDKAIVLVNSLPDNTLAVSSPSACEGETLVITVSNSVPGVSYQLRLDSDNSNVGAAVAGTGSNITFSVSPSTTTIYNVYATTSNSCSDELINKSTVTILDAPDNNLVVEGDEICLGQTAHVVVYNTEIGVTYQLRLDSDNSNVGTAIAGDGGNITFNINPISTTNYNVYAYNGNACAVELIDKPTVIVNPLPNNTLTLSDDQICAGDVADILLFNSQLGLSYQLRLDSDNSNVGSPQSGNGGTLTFHDSPTTNTTYNILATNTDGCANEMNDKSLVQVYPLANDNLNVSDPIICLGENAIIDIDNTQSGVMYQLRLDSDNSNVGAAVPGNNGTISVSVSPSASTMYNVLATTSNSCDVELVDRALVTVNPTPDGSLAVSSPDICLGETAEIIVYTSEVGVIYILRLDSDNTQVGVPVSGNGSDISFFVSPSSSTLYNILAIGGNACSIELTQKADVMVYPLPDPSLLVNDPTICAGEIATIILEDSEFGINYQLRLNGDNSPVGPVLIGDGGDLAFLVNPIVNTIYNILATSTDACSLELTDKGIVSVLPAPIINYDLSDEEICVGDVASITQSSSSLGVSYQLRDNATNNPIGAAIMGTGFAIQYNVNPLISTTYNVLATNSNTCSGLLTDVAVVTVNALPTKPSITANGPTTFCDGDQVQLTSSSAIQYLWSTGETTQSIMVTLAGSYTVTVTDENACSSPVSDAITISVNPLPVVSFSGLNPFYCHDEGTSVLTGNPSPTPSTSGVFGGPGIQDNEDGTAIFDPVAAGEGGPYNIIYTYTDNNTCSNSETQTVVVFEAPSINFSGLDAEYCVDNGSIIITGSEAPFGSFSGGVGVSDNGNGTATFNPATAGVGGPYYISYSYTNNDGCSNTYIGQTTVNELPTVTFGTLNSEYCVDYGLVTLMGNHAPQGSFSGAGIFDNENGTATFDPSAAGVGGPYNITYSYSDGNSCTNSSTQQTTIHALPNVNFSGLNTDYCIDGLVATLIGNHTPHGHFTGLGVTDNNDGTATFDPALAGEGNNIAINYTYSDANFCLNTKTKLVDVHPLPIVSIVDLEANYCVNDDAVTIHGNPLPDAQTAGYFTGLAITDNNDGTATFTPSALTAGNIYPISYTYTDIHTCENTYYQDVNIIELPDAPTASDEMVCFGQMVPNLNASGEVGFDLNWYDSDGNWVYTGSSYATGLTDVGVYTFTVTQTHTVTSCESEATTVTLSIQDLPNIQLPAFSDVCIYDFIIYLNTGTPAGGTYTGSPGILMMPNGDYIFHPEYAGPGIHDIIYTYIDPDTDCQNIAIQTITVHDRPVVAITDLNEVYCVSGEEVILHGNHPGYGNFSGSGIVDNGDGTAQFNPADADVGLIEITYDYSDIVTGCYNEVIDTTIVEGPPESVGIIDISDPDICVDFSGNITLEAVGGSGTWVNWFENSCGGNSPEILTSNEDSTIITIAAPEVSTYYYAQWETECGVSEICAEDYIVVTPFPTIPDTAWATPNIVCFEDQDSISLFIIGGNYGDILEWTQDSCTGAVVGQTDGDPLKIITPDTTTKYFARWINICGESSCTDVVNVRVIRPAEEVVVANPDSNYFCKNTLSELELRSFGGKGDSIVWYYDEDGLYPVPADTIISFNAKRDTILIVPPTISTSYYPFQATPCEQIGGSVSIDITVFHDPIAPDTAYAYPAAVCFGATDSVTLIAEGGDGITLEWYQGSCEDGVFLGSGNDFKVFPPNFTTAYFAKWVTPCGISACEETQIEIYEPTSNPDLIESDTNNICAGNLSEIQLTMIGGSGDSVVWYSDACNGTPLDPSLFYYQSPMRDTIIIPAPTTDTTFFGNWATLCEASECVSIDILVFPQPIIMDSITASQNGFCSGSVAEISLFAHGGEGSLISWREGSCDGPEVGLTDGSILTIPSPTDTTVYYASWTTVCADTECDSIQINVPPTPVDPVGISIQESLICDNVVDSITLYLEGGNGYEVIWFYGPYCGSDTIPAEAIHSLSIKGDSIRIARPAQSQVITANWASYEGVCGSSECVSLDVFVYEAPTAIYSIVNGESCMNSLLQFTPTSLAGTGLITNLNWNYGDGTVIDTNLQVDMFHAYEAAGDYTSQLIVTNTYGCEDTTWIPLTISPNPTADFDYLAACLGEPVQFTDQSISAVDSIGNWMWFFNDPYSIYDTSTLRNPTYAYSQAGVYEVSLTITDTSGCVDEIIQDVFISPSPTSYFKLGTASCRNVPVLFDDSSYTVNNEIGTWIWNFGDGSDELVINAPDDPDVSYTYPLEGNYTVSLRVIDTTGCAGETYYQYFEVRPIPIAGFATQDTACQTGIIHFFDTSYHQPGTTAEAWSWNFDDGGYAYDQNPVHSYIETGVFYDVQMIVTDSYGCSDSITQAVEVKPSMIIEFTSNVVCEQSPTQLIAHLIQPVDDEVAEWHWFFGDNTDSIVQNDTIYHQYANGGVYYTTLVGVDDGGCETIVINQPVEVNFAPEVDFFIPTVACNDPSVFYDHSIPNAESIVLYHFDYGDGIYETFTAEDYPDPVNHQYPAGSNQYIATITLTNSNGCEQTTEFEVLRESCIDLAYLVDLPACVGKTVQFINLSEVNHDDVEVDSIFWTFGDGVSYSLPIDDGDTVYHTYNSGGLMNTQMQLKARNAGNSFIVSSYKNIFVNHASNAAYNISAQLLCSRDSILFEDQSWIFDGEITERVWYFDDPFSENDTSYLINPKHWYAYGGDYAPSLIVVSDSGCRDTTSMALALNHAPINHLFSDREFGCGADNEIFLRDTAHYEGGNIVQYQWIFGFNDTVKTTVDSLRHELGIGEYNIISRVYGDNGCMGTDSIMGYNVHYKPLADFGYYPKDPTIKEPEVYFNDHSIVEEVPIEYYHWAFGDNTDTTGIDPIHIYQDTGFFQVVLTVQDKNGCVDTTSLSVYIEPIFSFYIPNAFSPNGNGLNDEFGPIGAYFVDRNYEFQIFSRWGELLFETVDPLAKWKGDFSKSSQQTVPVGVYTWIIRVQDAIGEEHVYKGRVTVVR